MQQWRVAALVLGVLALTLAAVRSADIVLTGPVGWLVRGWLPRVPSMPLFWVGVIACLVAMWRGGGT